MSSVFHGGIYTELTRDNLYEVVWRSAERRKKFSKEFQAEYRKPYIISNCLSCGTKCKDCGAGYWGNGKRGQLRGFYSEPSTPGYCGHFCAMGARCYEDV
ncbi:hypothetical protein CHARACLAT_023217 [Characodon lateralis]|uniref:CxC7-like cysteine cluster associated with KDZ transposases domain-containing protein n=1 Tax=Characodon lateralis TaxID=208331 RepID=A0ABU7DJ64_9TELE|nr:hypothetical protein [Characodon lateralis]